MFLKKIIAGVLLTSLLLIAISSCAPTPDNEQSTEQFNDQIKEPASQNEIDTELWEQYQTYEENIELAFTTYEEQTADSFEYQIIDGKVQIVKYIGSDEIVIVPEFIEGMLVTSIADYAFSENTTEDESTSEESQTETETTKKTTQETTPKTSVRAVSIPDSVTYIGFGVFEDCDNLTTLKLPVIGDGKENTNAGYIFGAQTVDNNRLSVPMSLDLIILSEGITEIPSYAFEDFNNLGAVSIPDSVTEIAPFAFYDCSSLMYINIGEQIERIGEYAFVNCGSLFYVDISVGVQSIGLGAFMECDNLLEMHLPYVGGSATENRYLGYIFGAESVSWNEDFVPKKLMNVTIKEGCENIADMAFYSLSHLINVTMPDSVEKIGVRAFYNCYSLREIILPENLKIIEKDAFFDCENLKTVTFGEHIEEIGTQAFYNCKSLISVTLPQSLKEIKASTFYGCESLESVDLGGVESVGKNAFLGCDELDDRELVTTQEDNA